MNVVIVGAGIGGLSLALSLHDAGVAKRITILEAAPEIRPLGVGVNLPPHATRELVELGLGPQLADVGIETSNLTYFDPRGNELWAEARGLAAGYHWPQYSVHRGRLQMILYDAVLHRLGADCVRTGCRVTGVTTHESSSDVRFVVDGVEDDLTADLVVGADGIKSTIRDTLRGEKTDLVWGGWVMYRGTTSAPHFLDGRTMVIVGDENLRVVVYPIENAKDGCLPTQNWILSTKTTDHSAIDFGNWNRACDAQELADLIRNWTYDWLDVEGLVRSARESYVYPMTDFDPLDSWTYGRTTLLGDAAHAMYPFGSNGASQAILDARVLANRLATQDVDTALAEYEATRIAVTAGVQQANRKQANEVMSRVSQLARSDTFDSARKELEEKENQYKRLAGFSVQELNQRASWSVRK